MAREDPLALGRQAEFGFRHASGKSFLAADIARVLELAGVNAQVAVRRLQELFELRERHAAVDAERAHDSQPHTFVDQSVGLTGFTIREVAGYRPETLRVGRGCRRLVALQYGFSRHGASLSSCLARDGSRRSRARGRYAPSRAAATASPCRAP